MGPDVRGGEQSWQIREGIGLVLPIHGKLIEFNNINNLSTRNELDLAVAVAHLRLALRRTQDLLDQKLNKEQGS